MSVETWMWIAQRASALVLAGAVSVHVATIVVAVRGGLTAGEILARVGGSMGWLAFYATFVVAAAVHASIGVRTVLTETTPLPPRAVAATAGLLGAALLGLGLRAAVGLYLAGAT